MVAVPPQRRYESHMTDAPDTAGRPRLKDGPEVLALDRVVKRSGKKLILNGLDLRVRAGEIVSIIGGAAGPKAILTRVLNGQLGVDQGQVLRAGQPGPTLSAPMGFGMGGTILRGLELRSAAYGVDLEGYINAVAALMRDPEELRKPINALAPADRMIVMYGSAFLLPCTHYTNNSGPLPADKRAKAVLRPLFRDARQRAAFICLNKRMTVRETYPNQRFLRLHAGQLHTLEDFDAMMEREKAQKDRKSGKRAEPAETT